MFRALPRTLLVLSSFALAAPALPQSAGVATSVFPNGVASGDVTADSIVLWARSTSVGGVVLFEVFEEGATTPAVSRVVPVFDARLPVKARVEGLLPGTRYEYRATDSSTLEEVVGTFRTAAAAGSRTTVSFGVSGDSRGELAPYPSLANVDERALDFFVVLGDTIYADDDSPVLGDVAQAETLAQYHLKHTEVLGEHAGLSAWADLRASTALFATIDDHEVTNDFAGGADVSTDPRFDDPPGTLINDSVLYETGLRAFLDYHPIAATRYGQTGDRRTAGEYKLYREQRFGDLAQIFLLDARSFRDAGLPGVDDPTDPVQVGTFLAASFDPTRTMLGNVQFRDLLIGLRSAQQQGVLWKFVFVAEPIQNLGPAAASDRFEGYAAERDRILAFLGQQGIENVVFVSADIHGTLVNDLSLTDPTTIATGVFAQVPVASWEITTGAVAYDAPFGPTVAFLAFLAGLIDQPLLEALAFPPPSLDGAAFQSLGLVAILDGLFGLLASLGGPSYSPLGLADAPLVDAELLEGAYTATHTYGWTQFEIDATSGDLSVTTYGVPFYPEALVTSDPGAVAGLVPGVVHRFVVHPD